MLLASILLALAWAALQGEITLANLLVGLVLGSAILMLLSKGGVMPATMTTRTAYAVELVAFFLWELVVANVRVAWDVVRPQTAIRPAVLAIPARRDVERRDPAAVDADQHHAGERHRRPVGRPAHAVRARDAHGQRRGEPPGNQERLRTPGQAAVRMTRRLRSGAARVEAACSST
jgi:hypothetical protein